MSSKSLEDTPTVEDRLNSALAAMEAVGLPIEKFVRFNNAEANKPKAMLFSNPLKSPQPNKVSKPPVLPDKEALITITSGKNKTI